MRNNDEYLNEVFRRIDEKKRRRFRNKRILAISACSVILIMAVGLVLKNPNFIFGSDEAAIEVEKGKTSESSDASYEQNDESVATDSNYELIDYSFEELCKNSDVCVLAEYEDMILKQNYTEYKFKVTKIICGQLNDDEIYLFTPSKSKKTYYQKGVEYALILERFEMLFYDHDRYQQAADLMLIPGEGKYTVNGKKLENSYSDKEKFEEDVRKFYSEASHKPLEARKNYASAQEQMEEESDIIAVVKIDKLLAEGIYHNGNNYSCIIKSFEKNNCSWIKEGMEIQLVLERGVVQEGKTYRIGFVSPDKNSEGLIFIQTAIGTISEE